VAAVDHPHIIPVYEAGEAGGVPYIAMRFVAGGDLRAIVHREGPLSAGRAAAFVSAVASALDAAHEGGLVHRDVKPANMLVDGRPGRPEHVYLSDFGLARGVLSVSGLTRAGQFLGTPDYAAPEQISGQTLDGRADQYGLACVAYTLLAGTAPFTRTLPMAVLYAQLSEPPPRLTAARPELPHAVDRVLGRALAKRPENRYDSCGDFADELRAALGVGPYVVAGLSSPQTMTVLAPPAPGAGGPPGARTPTAPLTALDTPAAAPVVAGGHRGAVGTGRWVAVVSADRGYYDSVQAGNGPDVASIGFPEGWGERRFELSGSAVQIGRGSVSRGIHPEIELSRPPKDPGVSRLHAVLVARTDGGWSVMDAGSPNGVMVNGIEVKPNEPVPLRDGDRIHLGIWTLITMVRG
jgi:serine/threonine-protein kinase